MDVPKRNAFRKRIRSVLNMKYCQKTIHCVCEILAGIKKGITFKNAVEKKENGIPSSRHLHDTKSVELKIRVVKRRAQRTVETILPGATVNLKLGFRVFRFDVPRLTSSH